ncbi:MAG TPA: HslU--HslV peptidase ATPase subunit, partial [Syntrophomonas sp.]|nr:HslU--HslV peptidase ATPase subunit [Syntrophomonas sp.]
VKAPFVKVEATKFTEVGYVGRDVDSMVRDLVETAIRMVKAEKMEEVEDRARMLAEERLAECLLPRRKKSLAAINPLELFLGGAAQQQQAQDEEQEPKSMEEQRQILRQKISRLEMEETIVEIEVEEKSPSFLEVFSGSGMGDMGVNLQDMFGNLMPAKRKKRKMTVAEARKILIYEEAGRLIDMDEVYRIAINRAEQDGIIFLDEIDKIAGREGGYGPDVSRGGVQRDILPVVEGSTIMTKYGAVKTDHMLFIAAGAFHVSKPSDLIPELQGRFPIRVELQTLNKEDLKRILTEPHNSLLKQYTVLLATEEVKIDFSPEAIDYIAAVATEVNDRTENIGARRLHTIMEKVLEDLLFHSPYMQGQAIAVDQAFVNQRLEKIVQDEDLSRFIL